MQLVASHSLQCSTNQICGLHMHVTTEMLVLQLTTTNVTLLAIWYFSLHCWITMQLSSVNTLSIFDWQVLLDDREQHLCYKIRHTVRWLQHTPHIHWQVPNLSTWLFSHHLPPDCAHMNETLQITIRTAAERQSIQVNEHSSSAKFQWACSDVLSKCTASLAWCQNYIPDWHGLFHDTSDVSPKL